jgi:hypothetical protein
MKKQDNLDIVKAMIRRRNTLEAPSIDLIAPEVRTAMTFRVSSTILKDVKDRIAKGTHLGQFVVEWGYDVAIDNVAEFQAKLNDIEKKLATKAPNGVVYKGTFLVYMSSDKTGGRYRTFWAFDSLAGIEAMGADAADKGFKLAVAALGSFVDRSNGAGITQSLYQTAAGTEVFLPQGG